MIKHSLSGFFVKTRLLAFLDCRPLDEKPVHWQWRDLWRLAGLYIGLQLMMTVLFAQLLYMVFDLAWPDVHRITYALALFLLVPLVRHYEFWPSASYLGTRLVDFRRNWKIGLLYGVALRLLPTVPVLIVVVTMYLVGYMPYLPENSPVIGKAIFSFSWFLGVLRGVIFAPIFEEYFFRGLLYPLLRLRYGVTWGIWLSSLFFGLMHGANILGFWAIFGGIGFALAYEHTGKLATPIIAHFIVNALATALSSF